MIIELPYDPRKFRGTSVKPCFMDHQQPISDYLAPAEIIQIETFSADISLIDPAVKSPLATLAFLALVKRVYKQPRKCPE